jgi:pimeloyl-ACP methyl ester carboxylesterase
MTTQTHQTAPTQFVEANGIRFAYRRFGKDGGLPTLVVNGSNDVIIYTANSLILQQHLPNAKLILYPDSAHGSLFQYPEMFVRDVASFLDQNQWA